MHQLTSTKTKLLWTPEAQRAFKKLKDLFTSTPILILPDSNYHFLVEVHASNIGVGAVLSERAESNHKIHL